jgi:uncharacterized membrane protein YfcA
MIAVVTDAELLAIAAAFAGGACHAATGFGFALVAAPLVAAAMAPETAVSTVITVAVGLSVLTLVSERRRPQPLWREAAWLLAWGAAGAMLGALLLERLDRTALQLVVSAGVLAALATREFAPEGGQATGASRRRWLPATAAKRRRWLPAAGFTAGALTTTTTTNGPPLLVYLLGRGLPAVRVRDTLSVLFVAFGAIGIGAIAIGAPDYDLPSAGVVAGLAAGAAIGHLAGRPIFARLAPSRYERVVAGLLFASVVIGGALALA